MENYLIEHCLYSKEVLEEHIEEMRRNTYPNTELIQKLEDYARKIYL